MENSSLIIFKKNPSKDSFFQKIEVLMDEDCSKENYFYEASTSRVFRKIDQKHYTYIGKIPSFVIFIDLEELMQLY